MKKVLLIAAVGMFTVTSCVKARTCSCSNGISSTVTSTKKDAKTYCDNVATSYQTSCDLK